MRITMKTFNHATTDGLLLAAVTIIIILVSSLFNGGVLAVIMWIIKLIGTNYMLYYLMKKQSATLLEDNNSTYKNNFAYGTLVSVLSNIVIAVFMYINITYIAGDKFDADMMQGLLQGYGNDIEFSNFQWIADHLGLITSIGVLIYYSIYGVIISAIMASFTKKESTPFTTDEINNNNQ